MIGESVILIIMTDMSVNKPNLAFVSVSASKIWVQICVSTPDADPEWTQQAHLSQSVVFRNKS